VSRQTPTKFFNVACQKIFSPMPLKVRELFDMGDTNGGNGSCAIHMSLQGKGVVGKSLAASVLAQYFIARGKQVHCIDADPVNKTLFQYRALEAKPLQLLHDGAIDSRHDAAGYSQQAIPVEHRYRFGANPVKTKRARKPLPPPEQRSWLSLAEAGAQIGCSLATIHRLRRGEIAGVPHLPAVQVGKRKWIVLKNSLERWQHENEQVSAA
jgi:hypothetical protein